MLLLDKNKKFSLNWGGVAFVISVLLVFFLALRIFYYLYVYGSIYPHWDEWLFVPISNGNIIRYLFSFGNENLQFFTNVHFALVEFLGLPFKSNIFISYGIYLCLLMTWYLFLRQFVVSNQRWMLVLLFVPFLSNCMLGNLFWSILSQSWLYFLFMVLAVHFGFKEEQSRKDKIWTLVMILFTVLAMNITFGVIFSVVYVCKNIYNAPDKISRQRESYLGAIWLVLMAIFLIVFFMIMQKAMEHEVNFDWMALLSVAFYERLAYFLVSPLFGALIEPHSIWCLVLSVLLLGWLLFLFLRQFKQVKLQRLWAVILILGGNIFAVTLFRENTVYYIADHSTRYLLFAIFIIPALLCVGLVEKKKAIRWVTLCLCGSILIASVKGFFAPQYLNVVYDVKYREECVTNYYRSNKKNSVYICLNTFSKNLVPHLERYRRIYMRK